LLFCSVLDIATLFCDVLCRVHQCIFVYLSSHCQQVLRLVSLPIWHGLSHGRLQLELAAQPALAKRWKALLKKEAKAAAGGSKSKKKDKAKGKSAAAEAGDAAAADAADQADPDPAAAAAAATELPRAEASFLPGMIQEFLSVLQAADAQLTGQQQQQEPQAAAAADADQEADDEDDEEEENEVPEEAENAATEAEHAAAPAAENALTTADDAAAAANGAQQQQPGKQQQQGRRQQQQRNRRNRKGFVQRLLLRHLERFVEWLIDLLSQLPTRRFVHALLEDQQLLVKVRGLNDGGLFDLLLHLILYASCIVHALLEEQQLLVKVGRALGS
jgi:hypothetical protein